MLLANIFNIQKFCVHDGPGIRTTVFFKGCPLNCIWCHNPESKNFKKELLHNDEKCTMCDRCGEIWKKRGEDGMAECTQTEKAVDMCVANALEIAGRYYSVQELMKEIEKDRAFYEESGGGVTFSGGESMCQIDFVEELAKRCRHKGIPVAIDTCGHVPFEYFERILEYTDIFLYDIKLMDSVLHKKYTGTDNRLIIDNLIKLSQKGAIINLRLPIIEGVNTEENHLKPLAGLLENIKMESVNLLPYHDIARGKHARLGLSYPKESISTPSKDKMEKIKNYLKPYCPKIKIGG